MNQFVYRFSSLEMESVVRIQIIDKAAYIFFRTHAFEENMNPSLLLPAIGKTLGQRGFISLWNPTREREGNLWARIYIYIYIYDIIRSS